MSITKLNTSTTKLIITDGSRVRGCSFLGFC